MNPEDLMSSEPVENPQFDAWSSMAEEVEKEKSETESETEASSEYADKSLREKRILRMEGKYEPTFGELVQMEEDEDFYDSDEYKNYVREKTEVAVSEHPEVYFPGAYEVFETVQPFVDRLRKRGKQLLECAEMMKEDYDQGVIKAMKEVLSALGYKPSENFRLAISSKKAKNPNTRGSYNSSTEILTIYKQDKLVPEDVIDTLAHELFHAHQHSLAESNPTSGSRGELYRINYDNYMPSNVDYNLYRTQLVEREAFAFGGQVGDICREAHMKRNKEFMQEVLEKHAKWAAKEYNPDEADDNIDERHLLMAPEIIKMNMNKRESVGFIRSAFKKWRNRHES